MERLTLHMNDEEIPKVAALQAMVPDYRVCWQINKFLGFNLTRTQDVECVFKSGVAASFSHFYSVDELLFRTLRLIGNEEGTYRYLPELGQTQFVLVGEGFTEEDWARLLLEVEKLPEVFSCVDVLPHRIIHHNRLIF
jgi:hypothetical protein